VGLYLIEQARVTVILWGISDRTGNRNRYIVRVNLKGQAAEKLIFWR